MGLLDLIAPALRAPADCVIRVDDQEIAELYPFLRELTAECSRDEASTARLVFETQRDEHGRWTVQDRGLLAPWQRIVIEAAFGQHTEELFRGFIREILADYPNESGASTVTVECQDTSLALDREHVRRAWGVDAPTTDGEIVTEIGGRHSLTFATKPGPGLSNLALYQNSTDIRFLRARAEANGYELYFRAGDMYFGPMQLDAHPQPAIMVYAGLDTNCLSLSVTSDGHLPNKVAFDLAPAAGTEITHREIEPDLASLGTEPADAGGDGLKDFTWLLSHEGSFDEDELTARAQRRVNDFALRVRAEGELDGTLYGHVLLPGLPVAVDGPGDWLGGVYYVDRVSHRFDLDGYRQQIRLLRNAYGDNVDAGPGVGRLAGNPVMSDSEDLITDLARRVRDKYYGKYRGLVASNNDPDQLGRLQLRIPSVLGTEVTDWALPCMPFGGTAGLGWFAIPEQDAQVWVEFEEGELRRPIWVGTFWQKSGDAPADAQKAPPTTRLLQTAAGHILQFDDEDSKEQIRLHHAGGAELLIDENGTITITDQTGNTITLDADQDQISIADTNNNAITMTATGVKIEDGNNNSIEFAPSGVTISSAGQIVLDATTVQLGGAGGEPVIKGASFLTLFATHVHTAAGPGSPTTPPVPQGESTTLSTAVLTK